MRLPRTVVWAGLIAAWAVGQMIIWKEAAERFFKSHGKSSAATEDLELRPVK